MEYLSSGGGRLGHWITDGWILVMEIICSLNMDRISDETLA
jgi:hypothetical protein